MNAPLHDSPPSLRPRLEAAVMHTRKGLGVLLARPFPSLATACAITLALLVLSLTSWLLLRTGDLVSALEEDLVLHAVLDPTLDEARSQSTLLAVAAIDGVETVRWVGPKAQRAALVETLGPELLEGLDDAVFPSGAMAEITLSRPVLEGDNPNPDAVRAQVRAIAGVTGVDSLPYAPTHIAILSSGATTTRATGLFLGLLALVTAVLCSFLLLRDGLSRARDARALLAAFGATARHMRAPYLFASTLIGLAGSGLAIAIGLIIERPLSDLVALIPGGGQGGPFGLGFLAFCLIGGPILALSGCILALHRSDRTAESRP